MAGSLSMQRIDGSSETAGGNFRRCRRGRGGQSGRRAGHFDREARAAAHIRFQRDLTAKHASDALDDRQSEAEAARDAGALVEAVELLEHGAPLRLRDADAGVADIDAQARAAAPAADQHAARWRIFDRVRNQVLQQAPQQAPVGAHREPSRARRRGRDLSRAPAARIPLRAAHQFVDAEIGHFRLHRAGIEPRNVEQRGEYLLDRFERGVDVADELGVLAGALALDQAGDVEPCGIERLQDVVARGGEEARLGDVGLVGLGLGALKLGVEPRQLARCVRARGAPTSRWRAPAPRPPARSA